MTNKIYRKVQERTEILIASLPDSIAFIHNFQLHCDDKVLYRRL